MTIVPNETEQALNRQYDVYAAAREEYRKKIAEQAAEIERLRAALEEAKRVNRGVVEEVDDVIDAALTGKPAGLDREAMPAPKEE